MPGKFLSPRIMGRSGSALAFLLLFLVLVLVRGAAGLAVGDSLAPCWLALAMGLAFRPDTPHHRKGDTDPKAGSPAVASTARLPSCQPRVETCP